MGTFRRLRTLSKLHQLYIAYDYPRRLYPFYMLYFALEDLGTDGQAYSYYWPDADRENIQQIIQKVARQYLLENGNPAGPGAAGDVPRTARP